MAKRTNGGSSNSSRTAVPRPTSNMSVSIRKIENGYLATTSGVNAKGQYVERQRYIKTLPKLK